jgi:hypothetical protein
MKSPLYIPSLEMNVVVEFFNNSLKFKIDYIPNKKYNERTIKSEVKKIISEMLKLSKFS